MKVGLLTPDRARKALQLARPSIEALLISGDANKNAMSIVVVNPVLPVTLIEFEEFQSNYVLVKEHFGDPDSDFAKYDQFATEKAWLSWLHGMSTHEIQQRRPYLIKEGEIKYGGAVNDEGMVVGGSGVQWYLDELCAQWVATPCKLLCIGEMYQNVLSDKQRTHI